MNIYKTLENGIIIAEYEPKMAEAIARMWNMSNSSWGGESGITTASQIIEKHSAASNFNVYIAMDGEEAVGYCSLARFLQDADTLIINLLNVRPDYHGKKVGKELVLIALERTIELGYPRLDLYTWPGNTKAVPLYKKCGFLWEDKPDSTHLVNFMPTILKTGLFAKFFDETGCDWYKDSARNIEICPDGKIIDKFQIFDYSWKSSGKMLRVGYESSGRGMRLIETDDYLIELTAPNHELPFGISYDANFKIQNKSGKPLDIKITGINDGNISFDYIMTDSITGTKEFSAPFFVGQIDRPQDKKKLHPCVMSDITINGETVRFGMGIEAKFPLWVNLIHERRAAKLGVTAPCYINIKNSMPKDIKVSFDLPKNKIMEFSDLHVNAEITANGAASIKTSAVAASFGHTAEMVDFTIKSIQGETITFKHPLHIVSQGFTDAFSFEDFSGHVIVNGPWSLRLITSTHENFGWNMSKNSVILDHAITGQSSLRFGPPKFGKPYDDEFTLADATEIRKYAKGQDMVLEEDLISGKFPGLMVTRIFTLSASGIVSGRLEIKNIGKEPVNAQISNPMTMPMKYNTYFHYDGSISNNANGMLHGIESTETESLDENWIFEPKIDGRTVGICWPMDVKPEINFSQFAFNTDCGLLEAGQTYQTEAIELFFGIFETAFDFRDYARNTYSNIRPDISENIVVRANGHNPFIANKSDVCIELLNNRTDVLAGEIVLGSDGLFDRQVQKNELGELLESNSFKVNITRPDDGIGMMDMSLKLTGFEKTYRRILFVPEGEIEQSCTDGVFEVSNGIITFKGDPKYSEALFSLEMNGKEWLKHQHPHHSTFAWWNPFIGGIHSCLDEAGTAQTVKEPKTMSFCEVSDNFNNAWKGIESTVTITDQDEYKGIIIKSYYLTLPGLPVLCHFYEVENQTGQYVKDLTIATTILMQISEDLNSVYAEFIDEDKHSHRLRAGINDNGIGFKEMVKLMGDRQENFYAYTMNNYYTHYNCDNEQVSLWVASEICKENGGKFVSDPIFLLLSEKDFIAENFKDLGHIRFC